MKIKSIQLTTADGFSLQCTLSAPISILRGKNADSLLHLLSAVIGDRDTHHTNCLDGSEPTSADALWSESDRLIDSLLRFIRQATETADDRPLFITNLIDRIDEAIDLQPLFQALADTGRQVFISVSSAISKKTADPLVQLIDTDSADAPAVPDGFEADYRIIPCPVCGSQTLDNHWICPVCGWEYDGLPEDHHSAANGASLRDYRRRYENTLKKEKTDEN